jgi:hypothetical protein
MRVVTSLLFSSNPILPIVCRLFCMNLVSCLSAKYLGELEFIRTSLNNVCRPATRKAGKHVEAC